MSHPLRILGVVLALAFCVACASTPTAPPPEKAKPAAVAPADAAKAAPAAAGGASSAAATKASPGGVTAAAGSGAEPASDEAPKESRSFLHGVLMYLPNRVIDLFDVARAGVNVGPGIGVDLAATEALQAQAFTHASVGLGLESLRHSPVFAGSEAGLGVGPLGAVGDAGATWYRSPTDLRVGAYVALVGAHVAVDPVEILDFIFGFLTIDLRDDDL